MTDINKARASYEFAAATAAAFEAGLTLEALQSIIELVDQERFLQPSSLALTQPRPASEPEKCGIKMHKSCQCVRPAGHGGPCNCWRLHREGGHPL